MKTGNNIPQILLEICDHLKNEKYVIKSWFS